MVPNLHDISHILKDTFYFVKRTNNNLKIRTVLGVASLYANISHRLKPKPLEYWIEKLHLKTKHLEKFTQKLTLKRIPITLKYNYFYINDSFIHQIKGTAMGTHPAVVYAKLTCGYLEVKYLINYFKYFHMI